MSDPLKELKVGSSLYEIVDEWARANKQNTLVSGTNIKTINGQSVLGSGNLSITGDKTYSNTVSGWNAQTSLISEKNAIYVYTDYDTDENGNVVPGIKIGDGLAYLIDMPFVDAVMQEHMQNTVIHVTQGDKDNWNNKCSVQYMGDERIQFDI